MFFLLLFKNYLNYLGFFFEKTDLFGQMRGENSSLSTCELFMLIGSWLMLAECGLRFHPLVYTPYAIVGVIN